MKRRRLERQERGSTLVEFGLVIVVLLMLMFGVIDFARALYAYHFVANAAREGTRYAIVHGAVALGCTTSPCAAPDPTPIVDYVANLAVGSGIIKTSTDPSLQVTPNWPPAADGGSNCDTVPNNPGCTVQVRVTYNFKFIFPFLPTSTYPMTSTSEMVISQ
jgi:Flp pilus assembly protein TadG